MEEKTEDYGTRLRCRSLVHQVDIAEDGDGTWLITLSDVFTLLLVFFITFLVMTKHSTSSEKIDNQHKSVQFALAGQPVVGPGVIKSRIADEIAGDIDFLNMGEEISVIATSREIIISMKEKITFRPGEADILQASRPALDKIADTIQKYPKFLVEINGHTDDTPIKTQQFPSNWELSVARATSVLKYFIHFHSINPSRLSIKGNADQEPIAPNDTPENRARNRRVEIRLKEIDT
jgi:chemotaxis protein MotB